MRLLQGIYEIFGTSHIMSIINDGHCSGCAIDDSYY